MRVTPDVSIAAAILMSGRSATRRSVSGEPRGPLCGMGICFECRVTVDGERHVAVVPDAVPATGWRCGPPMPLSACDVLIVGAGPAGIAAACAAAESGSRVLVLDENPAPGGQIWRGGSPDAAPWVERLRRSRR